MDTSELHKAMAWLGHGLTKEVASSRSFFGFSSDIKLEWAHLHFQSCLGEMRRFVGISGCVCETPSSRKRVCLISAERICAKQLSLKRNEDRQ